MIISRNCLQSYFKDELPSGNNLMDILLKHSFELDGFEEKENDFIIDVDVLPNRAHDCLSHRGIARELSGLLNIPILSDDDRYKEIKNIKKSDKKINILIEEKNKCRRYSARILENIEIKESPKWLKDRLESIGQKSINNIVDATNYVMFDIGNPIHAFDLDKLENENLIIRNAKREEEIVTLSGEEKVLDETILIISDEKFPLAIAGIKGGKKAEIDENTKNIVLEVANFEPVSTRKTRQKLFLMTDSSKRFENELSPELVGDAMNRISQLIFQVAGNKDTLIGEIADEYIEKAEEFEVKVNLEKVNKILGVEISKEEVLNILKRFNYSFSENENEFIIEVPSERFDLRIEEDFIEEIGRIYGYDKIKDEKVDDIQYIPEVNKLIFYQNKIRNKLIEENFNEVMLYSFVEDGEVEIENPITKDKNFLRTNLMEGVKKSLDLNFKNAELLGLDIIKIFEFGKVFKEGKEKNYLAIGIKNVNKKAKKEFGNETSQFDNLFLGIQKDFNVDFKEFTVMNDDFVFEIDFDDLLNKLPEIDNYEDVFGLKTYKEDAKFYKISQYPFVLRDISVWVSKGTSESDISETIKKESGEILANIRLVDEYEPEDQERKSFAFSLVFQSLKKTLSDNEVNIVMEKVTNFLNGNEGWEVR